MSFVLITKSYTEPANPYDGQVWVDTTTVPVVKVYDAGNAVWIPLADEQPAVVGPSAFSLSANMSATLQDSEGNQSGIRGLMIDKISTHPFFSGIGYFIDGVERWSNGIDFENDDYVVAWSAVAGGDVLRLDPHGRVRVGEAVGSPSSTVRFEITGEAGECVLSLVKDPTSDAQPMIQLADGTSVFRLDINSANDYISMGLTSNTPWYFVNGGETRMTLLGTGELVLGSTYGTGSQLLVKSTGTKDVAQFCDANDTSIFTIAHAGNISHGVDLVPMTTNARALGSSTLAYKELYLHDGTDEWKVAINASGTIITTKV